MNKSKSSCQWRRLQVIAHHAGRDSKAFLLPARLTLILVLSLLSANSWAANFNNNSIGVVAGQAFLTSGVKSASALVDINDSAPLSGFSYVRHIDSEIAVQLDYINFGTVKLTGPENEDFVTQGGQTVNLGPNALFQVSTQAVALSAQFRSWLNWNWCAQISLGAQRWTREVKTLNLVNAPYWSEKASGNAAIWSFGLVRAMSDFQMSLLLGSSHFGDDAIMHSNQLMLGLSYGF